MPNQKNSNLVVKLVSRFKKKQNLNKDIEKEADQAFMKNYSDRYRNFPKINSAELESSQYGKDYTGVYNQVRKVREKYPRLLKAIK